MKSDFQSDSDMAAAITRAASRQTDLTIRYLVDEGMVEDAYRTYGYFRWVDDWLDQAARPRHERLAFVTRQKNLMNACYQGEPTGALVPEETMLVNLVARDHEPNSGLQAYIRNMMSVMAFDADRRERLISERELDEYTGWLATAVTEAMHYFIGHCCAAPKCDARYQAVSGAHITHMLRDAIEDADAGYYNIPREVTAANQIKPWDVAAPAYREWVKERVQKARSCFKLGRDYLAQVESPRCRFAGYAYMRRFEVVLNSIEREGFQLRRQYPERKEGRYTIEMIASALWMALQVRRLPSYSSIFTRQVRS
jgi:phytoene/squalene synthetase